MTSPLRSAAQLAMMERVSTDADYAKSRGITQEAARDLLDCHEAAGSPKLPERAEVKFGGGRRAGKTGAARKFKLLGAH